VWFGTGCLDGLGELFAAEGVRSCLVVTGRSAYRASGAEARLATALSGLRVVHHGGVPANPSPVDVGTAVAALRSADADADVDVVLGVGGGSALDTAKLLTALAAQPGPPEDYLLAGRRFTEPRRQLLVLVPTTAGSGSEATSIAVLTTPDGKRSLRHPVLHADVAVVDPGLTCSVPPRVAAGCGLDALSHAVESYWSVAATDESLALAADAIRLLVRHLVAACTEPCGADREAMSRAALLAGQAIEITQTTAAHALSYPLTARYGIPHGHACGLFLGAVLAHNAEVTPADVRDPRGVDHVRARIARLLDLLGAPDPRHGRRFLDGLLDRCGLPRVLGDLGVGAGDLPAVADAALRSPRMANNPRRLDRPALLRLLAQAHTPKARTS